MTYNKVTYWSNRPDPNNDFCRSTTPNHISIVKPHIPNNSKTLEYGPGQGRMVSLYKDCPPVSFYDITNNYKSRTETKCKEKEIEIEQYVIDSSGQIKTPFKTNEFDIVCAFEVLLHSPSAEIEDVLKELARIGKKVIVITWWDNNLEKNINHCWTRDYKKLLSQNSLNLIHWDETSLPNQVFFTYNK